MADEKKEPVPAKVREEMQRGIPQRKAVSYADLPKEKRK
jgi:hypothetical protein